MPESSCLEDSRNGVQTYYHVLNVALRFEDAFSLWWMVPTYQWVACLDSIQGPCTHVITVDAGGSKLFHLVKKNVHAPGILLFLYVGDAHHLGCVPKNDKV